MCSKQGHKEFEDPYDYKKYNKLDTRMGCQARIRFDIKNSIWSVSHFNDEHSHEFASPKESCNLRSGRKVLSTHGTIIETMVSSGIKATRSYSFLSKELGGANTVGFLRRDCHNFLHTKRKQLIEVGDGKVLLIILKIDKVKIHFFFSSTSRPRK